MREYEFVGGPHAGERVTVQDDVRTVRVPVMQPIDYFSKVTRFRRGLEPTYDIAEYHKAGSVYRWEGLIGDAWSDMAVSEQLMADGGPLIRREIRRMSRRSLERMAPEKEVDRIVWRLSLDPYLMLWRVRALVGPRRVERGLRERDERRYGHLTSKHRTAAMARFRESIG